MLFQVPTVLFVCTGNIYRSRFAEALFNHHAQEQALGWCAFSRGLDTSTTDFDGLSRHTTAALDERQIAHHHTAASKTPLTVEDLEMAHLIIGLSKSEHQPMVAEAFPNWLEQFNFWQIDDTDLQDPKDAIPAIEQEVLDLLNAINESAQNG